MAPLTIKELRERKRQGKLGPKQAARLEKLVAEKKGTSEPDGSKPETSTPRTPLDKNDKKTKKNEMQLSQIASDVATKDTNRGIELGNLIAPDVVDGNFLDRLDPTLGQDRVNQTLSNLDEDRTRALTDSDELKFTLDTLKNKAIDGFTPQEREALSYNGRTAINSQLSSGMRAAQGFNVGRNIKGGFAGAAFQPAIRSSIDARRGLENDIMLAELGEKARALTEYGGITERRDQSRASNLLGINNLAGSINSNNQLLLSDIGKFNASQRAKEIAARTAKNATGLGIIQDEKDTIRQDQILNKQIRDSRKSLDELLAIA